MERENKQFWTLLEGEYRAALLFCRKLMKNREDGDDLYQDAIIVAHKSFDDLRETESFRPWLYRVIVNTFKTTIRKPWWKRRSTVSEEELSDYRAADPSSHYRARHLVRLALAKLPAIDQAAVTLFEIEGWTVKELAELRQVSEGAMKVKLHRIRAKMRSVLEKRQKMYPAVKVTSEPQKESTSAQKTGEGSYECVVVD